MFVLSIPNSFGARTTAREPETEDQRVERQVTSETEAQVETIVACVRLWFLRTSAVLKIRRGQIKLGEDVQDEDYESFVADRSDEVAGIYIAQFTGTGDDPTERNRVRRAAGYWLRSFLVTNFPGRPVFTRSVSGKEHRTGQEHEVFSMVRGRKVGGPSSQIYELPQIPS